MTLSQSPRPSSYLSPNCEARQLSITYRAAYARVPIRAGEVVAVWGGDVLTGAELAQVSEKERRLSVQIEEDHYLVTRVDGPGDWINHSCAPNVGLSGQSVLVAMRDIAAGEEICFDYAMTDSTPYDEFDCGCNSPGCRRHITGNDWRIPELWQRYEGYFSAYLQRRIDQLRAEIATADPIIKA